MADKKKLSKKKSEGLYLSDKPPLTFVSIVGIVFSYTILFAWVIAIIWPLYQMLISAFNGSNNNILWQVRILSFLLNTLNIYLMKHFI